MQMSDEKPIPPAKPLKKKRTPLMLLLDVLIIALAVTGIALVARPKIIHWQQDHYSQQLLDNFEQGEGTITFSPDAMVVDGEDIEYFDDMDEYETSPTTTATTAPPTSPTSSGGATEPPSPTPQPTAVPTPEPKKVTVKAIGRIIIDKIDVDMPIAEGSSKYNLRVAIGHYTPSAGLGQPGRNVLLGHRMYTYGRHFNRLGEVEVGDKVVIEDKQYRYTYTIDQIDRILPHDLLKEVYAPVDGSRIMLVTCDPIRVASHRLLVRGELTQTEPKP
ncbi:MAG: class D sortase, partial [Eubacteriales bacterium]|nr:class D sortase [Eubacteriales bacterium]